MFLKGDFSPYGTKKNNLNNSWNIFMLKKHFGTFSFIYGTNIEPEAQFFKTFIPKIGTGTLRKLTCEQFLWTFNTMALSGKKKKSSLHSFLFHFYHSIYYCSFMQHFLMEIMITNRETGCKCLILIKNMNPKLQYLHLLI